MLLSTIYDISGSAMHAQSVRLNTVASNLANLNSAAKTAEHAYQAKHPIFTASPQKIKINNYQSKQKIQDSLFSVRLAEIINSEAPVEQRYQPDHPYADNHGLVYYSNVDVTHESASMMAATREFESAVSILSSTRKMQDQLLELTNS